MNNFKKINPKLELFLDVLDIILSVIFILIFLFFYYVIDWPPKMFSHWVILVVFILIFLAFIKYFYLYLKTGQSFMGGISKTKLVDKKTGKTPSKKQLAKRFLLKYSGAIPILLVIILLIIFTNFRAGWNALGIITYSLIIFAINFIIFIFVYGKNIKKEKINGYDAKTDIICVKENKL